MSGAARAAGALALLLLAAGCSDAPEPGPTASASPTSSSADPFDVDVGDCVDSTSGSGEVTQIPVVPCAEPHVGEAYAAVQMPDAEQFPGDDAVVGSARGCEEPFEEFVGTALLGSQLRVTYFHPTAESWAKGDREILCIVSDPVGPVRGTLRGASR
jgi:hypothetical protein